MVMPGTQVPASSMRAGFQRQASTKTANDRRIEVNPENIELPSVRIIPFFGLQAAFDWKYFFSGK